LDVAEPGGFPRRFDQYVLLKPLARGGMGELYLAVSGSRGMEKLCVIKTVLPNLVTVENAKRFRDEAMVVVKLQHGNLVPVFDAGRHENQVYIAMEYVDGKDLLAVWNRCAQKRVPFPVDVAVYIVKELARGLGYAHGFGGLKLVHRDVSPANVLLSYTGEVKLTDFGLARSTLKLQQTAPGIIFGKLSYLAPEQARSEPLDGRTDLYAAGILLWELLTGQQLFPVKPAPAGDEGARRDSTADALERVRDPHVVLPSHVTPRVPPQLDAIVMRALAPDPAKRYQTGEELRADLAAFLAATTPQTDAARLASFLRPLFHETAEAERLEREDLVRSAGGLLSGAFSAEMAAAGAPKPVPAPSEDARPAPATADAGAAPAPTDAPDRQQQPRTIGRRHTDTAPHEGDAPGGRRAAAVTPHGHDTSGRDSGVGRLGEDPRVGTTLGGRYLIERLRGEGAMGRVYEARHVDIGRRLAIKVLHSSFRHSAEVVERFRREARAASKIGHPNIVDVTDSGTTPDGAFFFVMELLDGVDLEKLIELEGALPVERALRIAAQLCRALQAAHASEIIHRDLKPANVMLVNRKDEDDFVKVLDFGISRNMDLEGSGDDISSRRGLTRPDVAVGTPVYMSPEQAAGMRADALTDVYAVGGLLYEMLTATPPCAGDDVLTVLNKKATEDPVPIGKVRPELPADVQELVMRALSRRPRDRQPSMAALKDEVLRCLAAVQAASGQAAEARGTSSAQQRQRTSTERTRTVRPRPWMIGAGVGGFVGLMALVSFLRRSGEAPPPVAVVAVEPIATARGPQDNTAAETAPIVVPVEPPRSAPAPEPINLKRAARVVEPPGGTPAASALAAPWPTVSPPVYPQEAVAGGGRRPARVERGTTETAMATAGAKPAAGTAAPAIAATGPSPAATPGAGTAAPGESPGAATAAPAPAAPPAAAVAAAPTPETILARGQAAFDRGNYAEAIRRAKEAMAVGAAVPGHLLVADSYYHLQRYADALREYEAALALEPSNALARRGRELASKGAAER
jgi:serine/threonine protein kinase